MAAEALASRLKELIGCDAEERAARVAKLKDECAELEARRAELVADLAAIHSRISRVINGDSTK